MTGKTKPHIDGHPPASPYSPTIFGHDSRLRFNNDDHDDFIRPHPPTPYQRGDVVCVTAHGLTSVVALSLYVCSARVSVRMGVEAELAERQPRAVREVARLPVLVRCAGPSLGNHRERPRSEQKRFRYNLNSPL